MTGRRSACIQTGKLRRDEAWGWIRHSWPNLACDEGFKSSPTQPQRGGSRGTALSVNDGLQRAAHLDLLPLLILGRRAHLCHSKSKGLRHPGQRVLSEDTHKEQTAGLLSAGDRYLCHRLPRFLGSWRASAHGCPQLLSMACGEIPEGVFPRECTQPRRERSLLTAAGPAAP